LAYYKGKTTSAVVLDTISAELTGEKSYQAGCLAYYKGKTTSAVVLYTISAEQTGKKATKQDAWLTISALSKLIKFFMVP